MKKQKGITLIALVVTIIVLLILAGITLVNIMGDDGIIKNAADAKEKTEIGREKEIVELSYTKADANGDVTKETLQEEIKKYDDNTKVYTDEEDYYIEFKESGRVYKIDKDGKIAVEDSDILTADKTPRTARWRRNTRKAIYNNEYRGFSVFITRYQRWK